MQIPLDKVEQFRSLLQAGVVSVDFGIELVKGVTGKVQEVPYIEYKFSMKCYTPNDEAQCKAQCSDDSNCLKSCLNSKCDREEQAVKRRFEEAQLGNFAAVLGNIQGIEMVVKDVKLISISREDHTTTVVSRVYFIPTLMGMLFAAGMYYQHMCILKGGDDVTKCLEVNTLSLQACLEKKTAEEIKNCILSSIK